MVRQHIAQVVAINVRGRGPDGNGSVLESFASDQDYLNITLD